MKLLQLKNKIAHYIPKHIRLLILKIIFFPVDKLDSILNRRKTMIPPRGKIFTGYTNFEESGNRFVDNIVKENNITAGHKVLDVGCGIGRMAIPFTRILDNNGMYEGFDIFPDGITWCQEEVTSRYPNFNFTLADIYNKEYNPNGKFEASNYTFPYKNDFFDFIFLSSVFTHMMPEDIENYFSEISRVLKKGAKCWISFFLLNDKTIEYIKQGRSSLDFRYSYGVYRTVNNKSKEEAVAFDEKYIKSLYEINGLVIREPIVYGSWRSSGEAQDYIVAIKM